MSSCPGQGWLAITWQLEPLDARSYLSFLLPAQLGYCITAILVTLPRTYYLRLALLPLWLWCAFRIATRVDTPEDTGLGLMSMVMTISMRVLGWSLEPHHYVRVAKYGDKVDRRSVSDILYDAAELCCNFRGIGWNWSVHTEPLLPIKSRREFSYWCLKSYVFHALIFEVALIAYHFIFSPDAQSFAFFALHPYIMRGAEALVWPIATWAHLSAYYAFYAFTGVVVFRQDPATWPPLFDAPWRATSLAEFWGKCWHRGFRDMFGRAGGRPLSYIFGRTGYVLGTFFMSGVFHDATFWGISRQHGICCSMTLYFVMNGVGVFLESLFRKITGKKVCGVIGWVWMMAWLVSWLAISMSTGCLNDLNRVCQVNIVARPGEILRLILGKGGS